MLYPQALGHIHVIVFDLQAGQVGARGREVTTQRGVDRCSNGGSSGGGRRLRCKARLPAVMARVAAVALDFCARAPVGDVTW